MKRQENVMIKERTDNNRSGLKDDPDIRDDRNHKITILNILRIQENRKKTRISIAIKNL